MCIPNVPDICSKVLGNTWFKLLRAKELVKILFQLHLISHCFHDRSHVGSFHKVGRYTPEECHRSLTCKTTFLTMWISVHVIQYVLFCYGALPDAVRPSQTSTNIISCHKIVLLQYSQPNSNTCQKSNWLVNILVSPTRFYIRRAHFTTCICRLLGISHILQWMDVSAVTWKVTRIHDTK